MADIKPEKVEAAAESLAEAKAKGDPKKVKAAAAALAEIRTKYRQQEEAAGRRVGIVQTLNGD